jgi:uncharacterized protein Yka (UPF0111/DUF47 family)
MDDAIDQMNKTAKVIALFELTHFEKPMQQMGEIIVHAAKSSVQLHRYAKEVARNTRSIRSTALQEE